MYSNLNKPINNYMYNITMNRLIFPKKMISFTFFTIFLIKYIYIDFKK